VTVLKGSSTLIIVWLKLNKFVYVDASSRLVEERRRKKMIKKDRQKERQKTRKKDEGKII
jgi:hypothetical protein